MERVALLALSVAMSLSTPVWAGGEPAEVAKQARDAFTAGEQAFSQDDYELALRHFRTAMELVPHDAVRFNLAVCFERLGRFREAAQEYGAAARSPQLDLAARARAREQADRVQERLGTLAFETPPGAQALVDGALKCTIPCRLRVDPQEHEVEVQLEGRSTRAVVRVERGEVLPVMLTLPLPPQVTAPATPFRPGALFWAGGVVGALSFGNMAGFGAHAANLHDSYVRAPTAALRDEGVLMRDVANVSLVVGCVGLVLVAVDVLWLSRSPARLLSGLQLNFRGVLVHF